ncbi:MAG: hypothetical protein FD181_3023 [Prolixibacteraceae bacterium]|nr:MAG: hypothetical protein FD181_3023 [Prolixibacteraceae bacterium]
MKKNTVLPDFCMILTLKFQSVQCQGLAMFWGCNFVHTESTCLIFFRFSVTYTFFKSFFCLPLNNKT